MQVFLDNREKVLASIRIPERAADTVGENLRRVRERKLTFQEAIYPSLEFQLVEKSRLFRVGSKLFEQLDQTAESRCNCLIYMVGAAGLEPATSCV
jgi:hypothetical protein